MRAAQRDTAYLLAANDLIPNLERRIITLAAKIERLAIKFTLKALSREGIINNGDNSRDIDFLALIGEFRLNVGMRCLELVISAEVNRAHMTKSAMIDFYAFIMGVIGRTRSFMTRVMVMVMVMVCSTPTGR